MKISKLIVLGLFGLAHIVGLAGCIVSVSPDLAKTVIVKPGEKIEFKVDIFPQSSCTWWLDGVKQSEDGNKFTYSPTIKDLGRHYITFYNKFYSSTEWEFYVEQGPSTSWEQTWGSARYYEKINSIQQTSDGGYIVAGELSDGNVARLDAFGDLVWQKQIGIEGYMDLIQQTSDGGFILTGYEEDCYIIKLDASGAVSWQKNFGEGDPRFISIQQTADGGYIATGHSGAINIPGVINHGGWDCYVVKLDVQGNIQWQKMYGGSRDDGASSIQQTNDGGYVVAGFNHSDDIEGVVGNGNYYILKLDPFGAAIWQRLYDTQIYLDGGPGSVRQTDDGGYVVVGSKENSEMPGFFYKRAGCSVIKFDSDGNVIWNKLYSYYSGNAVEQTQDGGYIIAGSREGWNNNKLEYKISTGILMKLDSSGNKEWEKGYRKTAGVSILDVHQTADGGYIAAGSCDWGEIYLVWGLWRDEQLGEYWGWQERYRGNGYDFYVLKVGPDGEMN